MRPSFVFGILSNDPEGEEQGTTYYAYVSLNGSVVKHTWSIFDEINNSVLYQGIMLLKQQVGEELNSLTQRDQDSAKEQKRIKTQEDITNTVFTEQHLQIFNDILSQEGRLVEEYLNGNDKALNSLMGKTIKVLGNSSLKPLAIKHYYEYQLKGNSKLREIET